MRTLSQLPPATPESVWALLQETAQQQKETDRILKKRFAEAERRMKETDRMLTKKFAETAQQQKETERAMKQGFAETRELMRENEKKAEKDHANYERRMKNMEKTMGSWTNSHGSFAEEYFFNSFEEGEQTFFGEKFDEIDRNLKWKRDGLKDEYDIVMFNSTSVAIVEVKYKAHKNDIPTVLKKAETFRILYPHYKDLKIYLALASMSFYEELEQECILQGIAVIKQVGDTVVIHDEHLKTF